MTTISLEKRKEQVGISLAKRNVRSAPSIRVGLALDVSGSSKGLYQSGVMQEVTDRLLALAGTFDDDGSMDMWMFHTRCNKLEEAKVSDYGSYVKKKLLNQSDLWGGTHYAPIVTQSVDHFFEATSPAKAVSGMFSGLFSKKKEEVSAKPLPALMMVITDGENFDKPETKKALIDSQKHNIYWEFIGVGPGSYFTFIEEMADLLPNVGFVNMSSLSVTDEQLYDQVINEELCQWVNKAGA